LHATTLPGLDFLYGVVSDLTPTRVAAATGTFPEAIYHQILDALADIVFIKGPKSRLLWGNKALLDYYGMTNEQLRGIIDAPFNEPDYTQQYVRDDIQVCETGKMLDIPEEPLTRHDGVVHVVHTVKHPLRDADGAVIGKFGISHDITEQRRREKEQEFVIDRQRQAITAMSTPIIEIWEGVLTMPLIGAMDSTRAAEIMDSLLRAISVRRADFNIIDLTGIEIIDTSTANNLLNLVRAAGLLGSTSLMSGISPSVSTTMVSLGIDVGPLRTFGTLRSALGFVLREKGVAFGIGAPAAKNRAP